MPNSKVVEHEMKDQDVSLPIPLPSNRYQLRCPTMRSKRLPENPLDNIGVAPDFVIPFPQTNYLDDKLDFRLLKFYP